MTTFHHVIKKFLTDMLQEKIAESKSKDQPKTYIAHAITVGVGLFTGGRDLELSAKKQAILNNLITAINTYAPSSEQSADKYTVSAFISLIQSHKGLIEHQSRSKSRQYGSTEVVLDNLEKFSRALYQRAKSLSLLDHSEITECPFTHFLIAVTSYFARRDKDLIFTSIYSEVVNHPSMIGGESFLQALDAEVTTQLESALQNINALKTRDAEVFQQVRATIGIDKLRFLALQNPYMRQQHAAPAVGCLIPNYLDEYLQQALSASAYKKSPDTDVSCADRIEEFEFQSELDQLIEERRAQESDHLQTTATASMSTSASTTIGFK